jgi:hypothetical protein
MTAWQAPKRFSDSLNGWPAHTPHTSLSFSLPHKNSTGGFQSHLDQVSSPDQITLSALTPLPDRCTLPLSPPKKQSGSVLGACLTQLTRQLTHAHLLRMWQSSARCK